MKRGLFWTILGILLIPAASGQWAQAQLTTDFVKPKVDEEDLKLAEGKRKDDTDLRCLDGGSYIGGIDRAWSLLISGTPRRRAYYSFVGTSSIKFEGAYEAKDNFAIFTGTLTTGPAFDNDKRKPKSTPVRFGLNYAFVGDKVHFNVLRRTGDGEHVYRRQWFDKDGDKWELREEHYLTFVEKGRDEKEMTFQIKGTRTYREDKKGPLNRGKVEETVTYRLGENNQWQLTKPPQEKWLPHTLQPQWAEADKKGAPACYHLWPGGFGQVRGFALGDVPN